MMMFPKAGKRKRGSIASLKAKADRLFSQYIRQRDTMDNGFAKCITCGRMVEDPDCGHFISRAKIITRYEETNAHAQCKHCNRFKSGMQYEHGLAIDRLHGNGTAKRLLDLSKCRFKPTREWYEYTISSIKNLIETTISCS